MDKGTVTASKLKKNTPTLIILIVSGAFIYTLPYFKGNFYNAFVGYFNIDDAQMGLLSSAFGATSIIAYFLGGFCADRWPAKNLITISMISTGILGFVLLLKPPFWILFSIYCAWGITSILTFWSALVKAIRSLASSNEQGKAFGFFEGGRGVVNTLQAAGVIALFGILSYNISENVAISSIIIVYSSICILLGVLVFFIYKEEDIIDKNSINKKLIDLKALNKVLKLPTTWLQIIIIFCSYSVIINYYYIVPYVTTTFAVSGVIAAIFAYFSQVCRPVGSMVSGFAADKLGSSKILAISYIIMIIGILGIIISPGVPSLIWVIILFMAALYASMYAIQSMHFAIMEEGDYPQSITGTATAIITPLGYSAEFITPLIGGYCMKNWGTEDGFKIFFGILAGIAVIGLLATFAWMKVTKEKRMQLKAAKQLKKG